MYRQNPYDPELKNRASWKTYAVTVNIRAPTPEIARTLITRGFDATMTFEDKCIDMHHPRISSIEAIEDFCSCANPDIHKGYISPTQLFTYCAKCSKQINPKQEIKNET